MVLILKNTEKEKNFAVLMLKFRSYL